MSGNLGDYTFRLFKRRPSFVGGVSGLIDMSESKERYNYDETEKEADANSLRSDWCAIGQDMWTVIEEYGQKKGTTNDATK